MGVFWCGPRQHEGGEEMAGKKQKKKSGSGALIAILVIVIVLLIGIVGFALAQSGALGGTEKEFYGVNEPAKKRGVQVTLTGYQETYGSEWNSPSTGSVYILTEFEIENTSSKDVPVSSLLSFTAYADGAESTLSMGALMENNQKQLDGSVKPGKKMKGCVGYEIPDNWKEFEIQFISDVRKDEKFKFLIEKSKVESDDSIQENQNEEEVEENQGNPEEQMPQEESADSSTEFDYEDMHVRYTGHEIGQNMAGEQTLIVYFDFTNNSAENKMFAYSFSVKAFQNGVELDSSLLFSNDACKNRDNEIQPGTTINLGEDFVLGSDRSNISLQIEPFISFTNERLMDISLQLQ